MAGTNANNGGATGAGTPTIDPTTGQWTLGNGSLMIMPNFENMPAGTFAYANLADQMRDGILQQGQGAGAFNNNAAGRYGFGGPQFGTMNPNAAKGQGLLPIGGPGGGGGGYNPFAGRGNGGLFPPGGGGPAPAPGGPPGTLPGFPAPGTPGAPGGPRNPAEPPRGGTPTPPVSTAPAPTTPKAPTPYPGYGTPPAGVPFPDWAKNFGTPPKATNTLQNAQLAMSGTSADQAKLLAAMGGNQAPANQMTNAYQVSGQNYRPWLNALAGQGLMEPTPGAMAEQWASEGLGQMVGGKWQWAPGKGWDSATTSVY